MVTVISKILTLRFRTSWTDSLNNDTSLDTLLLVAVKTHQELGQNSLPKGYLVRKWKQVQYQWLKSMSTDTTGITCQFPCHTWQSQDQQEVSSYSCY